MKKICHLSEPHYNMLRVESSISDEVIKARGYRTIEKAAELQKLGFARTQCRPPGLLLPLHTTDGNNGLYIYRPDAPRVVEDRRKRNTDGTFTNKVIKYEIPKHKSIRLDCPPVCQQMLGNPKIPLWITEGQKKADALASRDQCAIALLGVWNFKGRNEFGGTTLLADFDYIALKGRDVRIVFDSDVYDKPQVQQALERLIEHLKRKGAQVSVVNLPPGDHGKTGVDDYFASGKSLTDLESLICAPRFEIKPALPKVKLLDELPENLTRPLSIIDNRAYMATWLPVQVEQSEGFDRYGKIVKYDPPKIKNDVRLFVINNDKKIFGEGGDAILTDLGFDVNLPEMPHKSRLISSKGVRALRAGHIATPAQIFVELKEIIDRFIDFDRSLAKQSVMCEMIACFILSTYFIEAFNVIGFLWPNGDRGSGKTQLLLLISELAYLGQMILSSSSYASIRDLANYGATLAFDDAEHFSNPQKMDANLRALLLAGNRRGANVTLKEQGPDKKWHTRYVNAYCPRLFSAIRLPDHVLASRTIVVPLLRTGNRDKANVDVLDSEIWPHDRQKLIDDLWSTTLINLSEMGNFEKIVNQRSRLSGRPLEPWKAILAIALWLDGNGVDGLWSRIEQLSVDYQNERLELETDDLTSLVLRGVYHCVQEKQSLYDSCDRSDRCDSKNGSVFSFETSKIANSVQIIAQEMESSLTADRLNAVVIGRMLGKMRFVKEREPGSGKRMWRISLELLYRLLEAYNIPANDGLKTSVTPVGCVTPVTEHLRRKSQLSNESNLDNRPNRLAIDIEHYLNQLHPEQKEEYEERAAIMQFEGGLSKEQAEREAFKLIQAKYAN